MLMPNQKYFIFLTLALLSSPLVARELTSSHIKLNPSPNSKLSAENFSGASVIESAPEGDTYTIAPQVQDSEFTYLMSDAQTATSHKFDEDWKSGGNNLYGSPGGTIGIIEAVKDLGDGVIQISVQVTALDAQGAAEPWVDVQYASTGLSSWRLDVGSNLGGPNPIDPDSDYKVVESGISVFNSQGVRVSDVSLSEDTSDSSGLSGVGIIGLTDGSDIAGYDMATMVMYWNIEIIPDNSGFNVTGGQSGAWYDPSHDGEGYVLQVISETQAVVYWFTYDKNGNQYWMIGVGEIQGSKIIFDDLQTTKGGKFGPEFDPADVERMSWGSLQFDFAGCDSAVVNYNGPSEFGSGTLNVQRLSKIWGVDCSGNNTATSGTGIGYLAPGFSGSWYDFANDGEGFTLEVLNENTALIYWFTYDTEGNQAWMMMIAEIQGASIFATDVYITSGGKFGPQFDPNDVVIEKWGAAVFSFGTCTTSGHGGSMRYLPPPSFGLESTQLLYRLVPIEGLDCSFLSDSHDVSGTMMVADNIFVDGDVNDPNVEETPNDLDDGLPEQQLVPPARVAGFATAEPTGVEGDRFEKESDEWDAYILALREGESVSLSISDWDSKDQELIDLDLYLVDVNDPDNQVDSSLTVDETEFVTAPFDGNFYVLVNAYQGRSNYLLQSGFSGQATSNDFDITEQFVTGQVMASHQDLNTLSSDTDSNKYRNRIETTEAKLGLTRIEESPEGDVLYAIDSSETYRLTPHPLTLAGFGSISPEKWLVIRVAKSLSSDNDYRWAGPNYIYQTSETPNDPGFPSQWHYSQIRLPEAWDVTRGHEEVRVAVLDSGVSDHPDLSNNVDYALGYDFVSDIFQSGDGDGLDSDARDPGELYPSYRRYASHGTHVSGTVGARTNNGTGVAGVNWNVTLMPVRVCGLQGCSCMDQNEGLRWAGRLANASGRLPSVQADVINMSLGGLSPCPGSQDIINQLTNRGIIVIAAAGNDGNSIPNYPASFTNVVSVSATSIADELAYYSSYGSNIDVSAPGGDVTVDLDNDSYPDGVWSPVMFIEEGSAVRQTAYMAMAGTSMASPHVAGVAALMKSVFPNFGPGEFRTAITSGEITVDLAQNGATSKDPEHGYGRIDALKAVEWAVKAEQGQQTDAFMTSSAAAIDFSSGLQSLNLIIEKAGSGNLAVSDLGWTESWISVSGVNLDQNDFGRYRVLVDRGGLVEGQYSGWIAFDADNGSRLWVSVLMRVGESASGEAGYVYGLLLDQWTQQSVKSWHGPQVSNDYDVHFGSNPPGTYSLMVSTDLDNDFLVCDDGELCEFYPNNSEVSSFEVSNRDIKLGRFLMGFPINVPKSDGESSSAFLNAMGVSSKEGPAQQSLGKIVSARPRE